MYQREYERRVRTAVVGIGSHSYRNILPALHFLPVELKAVCNRSNRDMAEKTAAEYGCRWYQDTEEMYRKRCNREIDNNGTADDTKVQIEEILKHEIC